MRCKLCVWYRWYRSSTDISHLQVPRGCGHTHMDMRLWWVYMYANAYM